MPGQVIKPGIKVLKGIPEHFYTYMLINLEFLIWSNSPNSSNSYTSIGYLDGNGKIVEIYKKSFSDNQNGYIEDVGSIVESYVKTGIHDFTWNISGGGYFRYIDFSVDYVEPELIIKDQLPKFVFSSSLDHMTFSMIQTRDQYSAKFELRYGIETILSEIYVPDVNNEIIVRDLSSLIVPYLQESLIGDFEVDINIIKTTDGENMAFRNLSFTALYCMCDVNMSAESFVNEYFLSMLMGDKITSLRRKEYLHFEQTLSGEELESGSEGLSVNVLVISDYIDDDLKRTSFTFSFDQPLNLVKNQVVSIDVSPDKFKKNGLQLIRYKVQVGDRIQKFIMDSESPDVDPELAFINSFGCIETLYFTGTKEIEPSIKRSAAFINGVYRNYYIDEERTYKANTGIIPESMLCLVDELARATKSYLIENGEIGRQVTVTDSETKRNNDYDTLYQAIITYRLSSRNQNVQNPFSPAKTFDNTFDNTFE